MKRLVIGIFVLCLMVISLHAQNGEFDPVNPGDPQPVYSLTVQVSPTAGGTTNITHTMLMEGQQVSLHISPNENFEFQQWVCGEEVLSSNTNLNFTMPERNVTITAQMVYESEAFNPQSPGDPQAEEPAPPKHKVTIYVSPAVGGNVNVSSFYLAEGGTRNIYAYNNAGYEFVGWYIDDKLESQTNPVNLTMRKSDIMLTARFRFNPLSPGDPGANFYNEETGEVIIDRFEIGQLSNVAYSLIGNNNLSKVTSLTVVGEMNASDYGVINNFNNLEMVDLSHTTGYTEVPSWAFGSMTKINRILLPSTVETIGQNAFYGCTGLKELVLHAQAPPTSAQNAASLFYNVGEDLVIRVPDASVSLYHASNLWNSFVILPMDVKTLNVTLPEEKAAQYENMFLELLDTKSGQQRRYVITQRYIYSFSGIFDETTYQLTLRNAQNKVFGQEMVTFDGNDTTITFSSLLQPVDLSVHVLNDKGEDLTAHTSITWMDGDSKYICKGTTLSGQVEGDILYYKWELDEEAGTVYQKQDSAARVVANKRNNVIVDHLQKLPTRTIYGVIADSTSNLPINGASIVVNQRLNDKYNKIYNSTSTNNGSFSVQLIDAPFDMVVTATDYMKREITSQDFAENNKIVLAELSGATISYGFQYQLATEDGEEAIVQNWYNNYNNVDFTIFNTTKNTAINKFEIQYPRIILLEDVADGDELCITVSSRDNDFMPLQKSIVINDQKASANFEIKELGQIRSVVIDDEDEDVIGCLYDAHGKLVRAADYYKNSLNISNLVDGNYTLVTMRKNDLFNSVYNIADLAAAGLVTDSDYVANPITVVSGRISRIYIDQVPMSDATILYYTGNSTSFTVNKSSVVIGNYLTFTGRLDFKSVYASQVRNVQLIMDIPEGSSFVDNSVMVGNTTGNYTLRENQVVVPLASSSARVRFCAIPTISGTFAPSAYVCFELNGKSVTQPIGAANFTAQALSISVPETTAKQTIIVSGVAQGKAEIEIYDNGNIVGRTTALATGQWSVECELANAYNLTKHSIYAKSKSLNMELLSETQNCYYSISSNVVRTITMSHYNSYARKNMEVVFDLGNGTTYPSSYDYYSDAEFSFTVDFMNNDTNAVSDVFVYTYSYTGEISKIQAIYDQESDRWIAKHVFTNEDAPVNVSVEYTVVNSVLQADRRQYDDALIKYDDFIQTDNKHYIDSLINAINEAMVIDDSITVEQLIISLYDFLGISEEQLELYTDTMITLEEISSFVANEYESCQWQSPVSGYTIIDDDGNMHRVEYASLDELNNSITNGLKCDSIPLTDSTFIICYSGDDIIIYVDVAKNIYLLVKNEYNSPGYSQIPQRYSYGLSDLDGFLSKWSQAENIVNSTGREMKDLIEQVTRLCNQNLNKAMASLTVVQKNIDRTKRGLYVGYTQKELFEKEAKLLKETAGFRYTISALGALFKTLNVAAIINDIRKASESIREWIRILATIQTIDCYEMVDLYERALNYATWVALGYNTNITTNVSTFVGLNNLLKVKIAKVVSVDAAMAVDFLINDFSIIQGGLNEWNDLRWKGEIRNKIPIIKGKCNDDDECGKPGYPPCPCKGCGGSGHGGTGGNPKPKTPPTSINWDPAGFVYEGVEGNRVEGVMATVYYKDTYENIFGEQVEESIMWNAEDYDQENPLYTDENGFYQWFVPQGLWQVRFEKEGYEPTQSEWLPVPPPQLEVNIPIVQLRQPEVINAIAHKDAIDITFDKYMMPSLLNTDNVFVTANNQLIAGTLILLDEQHSYVDEFETYASKIRFIPESEFTAPEIMLTVSNRVRSYADVPMVQTFQQTFDVQDIGVIERVQTPIPSILSGTQVELGAELTLSCATEGAVIRYTIDGSIPDCLHGLIYSMPIMLSGQKSMTIYAIACADGYNPSDVVQWIYTFEPIEQALEETIDSRPIVTKLFKDGHIFILRGDKIYTIQGQLVK